MTKCDEVRENKSWHDFIEEKSGKKFKKCNNFPASALNIY